MTLSIEEFTERWLQHVPLPGQRVVRSYGLYHHALNEHLESCQLQIEATGDRADVAGIARKRAAAHNAVPTWSLST